ncbi:(-)-germacrene D synthase-like isoform X2 [Syzygium oleosum]|uniref:(-)-germacrene D synthase-like isoform X2 n=1 Tax=Syzygium oleosum TaxID=219896 RepID=UPI0024BAC1BC|nr:(-)-germacrene D synthase-like isoform X2 [Syzygium oleosum]
MSLVISTNGPLSAKEKSQMVERRPVDYHPSLWEDYLAKYAAPSNSMDNGHDQQAEQEIQKLKDEVKRMLCTNADKPSLKLDMIDQIQRLGIAYHFTSEIDHVLKQLNEACFVCNNGDHDIDDLYTVALLFRLLRQQGYWISCDIFNKFKDTSGKFSEKYKSDVRGLLSLYEASHLSVHGEDVLDQALSFSLTHLESIDEEQLSPPLTMQVRHALKQTIRRGVPRLEARLYISMYEAEPLHNKILLSLAKLDFNHLQEQHRKELCDLARWWMGLDFKRKLPFARDRLVEGYFWILGVHFEPELVLVRRMLTKVIAMTSVLDDIYDVYGTYEELELFTQAVQRWDIDCINDLPEYMQVFYKALIDVYVEIGEILACKGRLYGLHYAKEAMKRQARYYFAEANWLHQQHKPTMDEYMSIAVVSSGYPLLAITSFVGMQDMVTKDDLDWLFNDPKILKASTVICRLMDDLATHKFEQGREHADSAVQCYMKHYGVTEREAENDLAKQVNDAWKDMNEECLHPTTVAMPLLMGILNLTRVMDVLYKDGGDHYTNPHITLKDYIRLVLMDPVQ